MYCRRCGSELEVGEDVYNADNGSYYCQTCADEVLRYCVFCEEYHFDFNFRNSPDGVMCENCWSERYVYCYECDDIIELDDAIYDSDTEQYFCEECYHSRQAIGDYHHTEANQFYSLSNEDTNLFFGIELEVDNGDKTTTARELQELNSGFWDIKHDGSLNNGFEIASQPATMNYHFSKGQWEELMNICLQNRMKSHDAGTCGLHIHINKSYFTKWKQAVVKLWIIFENNKAWLSNFSRRNYYELDRWAKFKDDSEMCQLLVNKEETYANRYQAINSINEETIEFRLYRGTLRYSTFVATLQLTKWLVEYVETHTECECHSLCLEKTKFSDNELNLYLQERGLK